MEENAIPKHAGPEAKVSTPATGLTLLWARNPLREILTTGKCHGKKPDKQDAVYLRFRVSNLTINFEAMPRYS